VRTVGRPDGAMCTAHWFTERPNAASCSAGRVLQSLPGARSFRTTLTTAGISLQSRLSPLPSMSLRIHYFLIITTLNGIESELKSTQTSKQANKNKHYTAFNPTAAQYTIFNICHFTMCPLHTLASKCPSSGVGGGV